MNAHIDVILAPTTTPTSKRQQQHGLRTPLVWYAHVLLPVSLAIPGQCGVCKRVFENPSGSGESPGHGRDHGEVDHGFVVVGSGFVVAHAAAVAATRYHRARCTGWRPLSHGGNASRVVRRGLPCCAAQATAVRGSPEYTAQPCPRAAGGGHDGHGEIGDDGIVGSWSGRGLGNHRPNQEPTSSILREAHARPSRVLKHSLNLIQSRTTGLDNQKVGLGQCCDASARSDDRHTVAMKALLPERDRSCHP